MKGYNRILAEGARESFERMYEKKKTKTDIWKYIKWLAYGAIVFITIRACLF